MLKTAQKKSILMCLSFYIIVCSPNKLIADNDSSFIDSQMGGISFEEDSKILPGAPEPVTVRVSKDRHEIFWQGTRLDILVFYRIYRHCGETSWQRISEIPVRKPNIERYEVSVRTTQESCQYAISAVDHYGNEGHKSNIANIIKSD